MSTTSAFLVQPTPSTKIHAMEHQPSALKLEAVIPDDGFLSEVPSVLAAHQEAGVFSWTPVLGSSLIMLTIVGLLYAWEVSVEWLRESIPKTLLPMVESILGEIGGLGFIGLILQSVLGNNSIKEGLEELSVQFFGEGDILVENFEFLHAAFFQVGIGYFVAAGAMVSVGLKKLADIETVQGMQFDQETGSCTATMDQLATYCPGYDDQSNVALWDELTIPIEERAARTVLMRSEVFKWFPHLPDSFRVETYLQASFAYNLKHVVELSPLTWIYLIPALALPNSIDLSHEVINAASPNAAESAGYFFSTFAAIVPGHIYRCALTGWGIWNLWKMNQIKHMLLPRVGLNELTGQTQILDPLFEKETVRQNFDSSPAWVRPIENVWAKPATNKFEELFGTAGAAGPTLYRNSIKYHSWLCLANTIFFGTQVLPRDISEILTGATVGDPEHLTAELVTYTGFVALSILQLIFVDTPAFWNYCLVAGADPQNGETFLKLSGNPPVPITTVPSNSTAAAIA